MIDNRLKLLILQHPHERKAAFSTAPACAAALAHCKIVVGLSWPNLARAAGEPAEPGRWAVLYLGSARPQGDDEILAVDRHGAALPGAAALLRRLDGAVLLDGTWREAKTLWWRNPWLLRLHRLVLNPRAPARLGPVRREPRGEALSTLEAAALVLRHAETGPQAAEALLAALDRLVAGAAPVSGPV